jgi:hypothetical protein
MAETAEHFQLLHRLPDLQEDGRFVAPCVGPHDEAQHPPRALPEFRAESVPMRAGELRDDLFQIQAEVVTRLVDRQVLGLRHEGNTRGLTPPGKSKGRMIEESITSRYALLARSCRCP